jgi:hypothetical protein
MPKSENKERVEAHLHKDKMMILRMLAAKSNRSLKNYVETLLLKHIEESEKSNIQGSPERN